jgi:hypothetical protein
MTVLRMPKETIFIFATYLNISPQDAIDRLVIISKNLADEARIKITKKGQQSFTRKVRVEGCPHHLQFKAYSYFGRAELSEHVYLSIPAMRGSIDIALEQEFNEASFRLIEKELLASDEEYNA